jgi:hypothetical protein
VLAFLGTLRRSEGLGLESRDYIPSITGQLLVRENANRGLKTPSATRAAQLAIIAYPFTELVQYVSDVFDPPNTYAEPGFCDVSEDAIIPIIHQALWHVTRDKGCTLHTLRQSRGTLPVLSRDVGTGAYHKVKQKHLKRCVAEFNCRLNRRTIEQDLMVRLLRACLSTQTITCKQLVAMPELT